MKLKVSFGKLHCHQVTTPHDNDDEIYLAVAPLGVKAAAGTSPKEAKLQGALSHVIEAVKKGRDYDLKLRKTGRSDYEFETDDAESVAFAFTLCEQDSGSLYDELRGNPHFKIPPNYKIVWKDIEAIVPSNPADPVAWALSIGSFLLGVMKGLMADDRIKSLGHTVDLAHLPHTDKLVFKGDGGHYEVEVTIAR